MTWTWNVRNIYIEGEGGRYLFNITVKKCTNISFIIFLGFWTKNYNDSNLVQKADIMLRLYLNISISYAETMPKLMNKVSAFLVSFGKF
jgi:hypothetical protein